MKYIYGFTMLLSLVAAFMVAMLGMQYVYEGEGLHPYVAGVVALLSLCAGFFAASRLHEIEIGHC